MIINATASPHLISPVCYDEFAKRSSVSARGIPVCAPLGNLKATVRAVEEFRAEKAGSRKM